MFCLRRWSRDRLEHSVANRVVDMPVHDLRHIRFEGVPRLTRRGTVARNQLAAASVTAPESRRSMPDAEPADPLVEFVLKQSMLDPKAYRSGSTTRRVPACLRLLRVSTEQQAISLLKRKPELLGNALDALLIGVSEFFRDAAVFECLARILPGLAQSERRLRAYSAGCSEGQEIYSLAILLAEAGSLDRWELVGADCRPSAIATAKAGLFNRNGTSGVGPGLQSRYFRRERGGWRISETLRQRTQWRVEELLSLRAAGKWNLIFFRNVAIYLRVEKAAPLWASLCSALETDGLLVTGKAERPPGHLPLIRLHPCIYRKVPDRS